MRVLVTGASGMLGHMVFKVLSADRDLSVYGSIRFDGLKWLVVNGFKVSNILFADLSDPFEVNRLFSDHGKFDVVVNCAGIVKQVISGVPRSSVVAVNSMLPHYIAKACNKHGGRLIHISTDCVFSGRSGGYSEFDIPDAEDIYGQSKLLGEVIDSSHLTIRTSIVGRQLYDEKYGLLEWFLSQKGVVYGFERSIWSGVTTLFLAQAIRDLIKEKHLWVHGLLHIVGESISKYQMLTVLKEVFKKEDVEIVSAGNLEPGLINRSLVSYKNPGIKVLSFKYMVEQLKEFENGAI